MNLLLTCRHFGRVDRRQQAVAQVVVKTPVRQFLVGTGPADDEGAQALVSGPPDEGVALAQVEDVILVDPWRHDQQWPAVLFGGRRQVLDQLQQLVLENDLAGRGGDVLAKMEGAAAGHRQATLASAMFEILEQFPETVDQVPAIAVEGCAQDLGVGQRKVRRRQRGDVLFGTRLHLTL